MESVYPSSMHLLDRGPKDVRSPALSNHDTDRRDTLNVGTYRVFNMRFFCQWGDAYLCADYSFSVSYPNGFWFYILYGGKLGMFLSR